MPIAIQFTNSGAPLGISGEADVYSAAELRESLLDYLRISPEPVVDLSGLVVCDASGLQLLLAARKSAAAMGKTLRIDPLPIAVAESCGRLGVDLTEISLGVRESS